MMRFDAETYLPEDVLTKVDRMSMAHSIESRVPLLDNQVIDFAASLPAAFKIKNGRCKHVLKEVAAALLPAEILNRRKQGFGVPLGTWFRGNLRELFADTLLSPASLQRGYFQPAFVRQIDRRAPGWPARPRPTVAAGGVRTMASALRRPGRWNLVVSLCPRGSSLRTRVGSMRKGLPVS
jgi:asparagine synthetase B (glutamine-hydrolysing)